MGHNGKLVNFDRNRAAGPWQPLQPLELSEEARQSGVLAGFHNNRYRVFVKQMHRSGMLMAGPGGEPQAVPIIHLIIAGLGGRKPTYAEIQRIKNELVHEESDAAEIYPSRQREVDSPQTHLWCLPPGYMMPFGLMPRAAAPAADEEIIPGATVRREDLLFYVVASDVDGQPVTEVFADEADARACYERAGNEFEAGTAQMYGTFPTVEEGAAWSPAATERMAQIQARFQHAMSAAPMVGGPIDGEATKGEDRPSLSPEELKEAMRAGIEQKQAERLDALMEAQREAEEAQDVEAAKSLAELRTMLLEQRRAAQDSPSTASEDGTDGDAQ